MVRIDFFISLSGILGILAQNSKEHLFIKNLTSIAGIQKRFWHFEQSLTGNFDPDCSVMRDNVLTRSFLDNLSKLSNVTYLRIELGIGRSKPEYLLSNTLDFYLPIQGKTIFTNEDANWDNLQIQISQFFKISSNKLLEKYIIRKLTPDSNGVSFLYGSDPIDFFCSEFVERMISILPLENENMLIKFNTMDELFKSDYLSTIVQISFDQNGVSILWEFNIIEDIDIEVLSFAQSQEIIKEQHKENNSSAHNYFYCLGNASSPNLLKSNRYITELLIQDEGKIIYEISNANEKFEIYLEITEYFLPIMVPLFSQLNIENIKGKTSTEKIKIDKNIDQSIKVNIGLFIEAKAETKIVIPFEKYLKPFENYPPDANRGEDLMPSLITFRLKSGSNIQREASNHNLFISNHPDFSMAFTIITMSLGVIGYWNISIYRTLVGEKNKQVPATMATIKRFLNILRRKEVTQEEKFKRD